MSAAMEGGRYWMVGRSGVAIVERKYETGVPSSPGILVARTDCELDAQDGVTPTPVCHERALLIVRAVNVFDDAREALRSYLSAQARMLGRWAEGDDAVKRDLWRELHRCEDAARLVLARMDGKP